MCVTVSPKADRDRESFERALKTIAQQDRTIRIETESAGGQTILSAMGEVHLELICDRVLQEYGIEVNVGEPAVVYLETIRADTEAECKYIRQTGGLGNYGHVKIHIEPNEPGNGYEFSNEIKGGVIPKEYINPIDQGI
jgi:elongation factor G